MILPFPRRDERLCRELRAHFRDPAEVRRILRRARGDPDAPHPNENAAIPARTTASPEPEGSLNHETRTAKNENRGTE